jgi:two-component system, LytTR family, sensor kinase
MRQPSPPTSQDFLLGAPDYYTLHLLTKKRSLCILEAFDKAILGQTTLEQMAWEACELLGTKLSLEDCSVFVTDLERLELRQIAVYGKKEHDGKRIESPMHIPLGMGICGFVALTGVPKLVDNTLLEPLYLKDDKLRLSEVCVPIICGKIIIGVLDCESSCLGYFNDRHVQLLKKMADKIGTQLKRQLN